MRSTDRHRIAVVMVLLLPLLAGREGRAAPADQVLIPAGSYFPFIANRDPSDKTSVELKRRPVELTAFWLDVYPVTQQQYLDFVKSHAEWRRSRVRPIFADGNYLDRWKGDLRLRDSRERLSPVTQVSWFAASAYCEAKGRALPTLDQWEYAAADAGRNTQANAQAVLDWYARPNPPFFPEIGTGSKSAYGVRDLFGLIWEWTADFNSVMVTDESRGQGSGDRGLFCGAGALGALDATDYAAFLRFGFRGSLRAAYTTRNLGFRCAKETGSI